MSAFDRLYRAVMLGQRRMRVLENPGETLENTPEDTRRYVEFDDGDDFFVIAQGDDRIVIAFDEWERFCVEVTGAALQLRACGPVTSADVDGDEGS